MLQSLLMSETAYFFTGWEPLIRILVVGTSLFLSVVLLLRITGNRTLSSLTTFDFVVMVAIGAVFGRALTARDLSYSEAFASITLLVVLQYLLSLFKFHSRTLARAISSPPVVLYSDGTFHEKALHRERLTREDLLSAIRAEGYETFGDVDLLVLETAGRISVIVKAKRG